MVNIPCILCGTITPAPPSFVKKCRICQSHNDLVVEENLTHDDVHDLKVLEAWERDQRKAVDRKLL